MGIQQTLVASPASPEISPPAIRRESEFIGTLADLDRLQRPEGNGVSPGIQAQAKR
jgi:hypothetical protein